MASQELMNDFANKPEIFRQTPLKELETLSYFKILYNYPPKIRIHVDQLSPLGANIANPTLTSRSKLDSGAQKSPQNISDYLDEYKMKRYTSAFYEDQAAPLKEALKRIPVYIVLNSNQELILARPVNRENETPKNPIYETLFNFVCSSNHISSVKEAKLGLFFMSRKDAEMHKNTIFKQDPQGAKRVGLAIHCVGLDSAYQIMRQSHSNVDFKIVPNLDELSQFLSKKINDPKLIFDELQYQTYRKIRPVRIMPKFGRLDFNQLIPFFSFVQNNEYFKGVPLYIVQYKNPPRNFNEKLQNYTYDKYFRSLLRLGRLTDAVYGRLINARDFLVGFGQRSIMQGKIETAQISDNITNYAFFSIDQASQFIADYEKLCKENKRLRKNPSTGIIPYIGSRANTSLSVITLRPKIFVTNLEDFVERWEEALLLKNKVTQPLITYPYEYQTIFDTKETIFVPKLESRDSFTPYQDSNIGRFKNGLLVKYRKFKATFRVFTEA